MNVDEPEAVGGFTRREHSDFSLGYVSRRQNVCRLSNLSIHFLDMPTPLN